MLNFGVLCPFGSILIFAGTPVSGFHGALDEAVNKIR